MRRKTRYLMQRSVREKGKRPITSYLQEFTVGDKVALLLEPSIQEGIFHKRFHGKGGYVTGKSGECYMVEISDLGKKKSIIVHPVHMKRLV
ncbi:MAG: 50S ribosomal protein L21e [Nitrosarchaeum sp.]|nr:50S ribosomal protein L21e [Nitrosarchaeum sp.]